MLRSAAVALSLLLAAAGPASGFLLNAPNRSPLRAQGTTTTTAAAAAAVRGCGGLGVGMKCMRCRSACGSNDWGDARLNVLAWSDWPPRLDSTRMHAHTRRDTKRPPAAMLTPHHPYIHNSSGGQGCACRLPWAGPPRCPRRAWAFWAPRATRAPSWCVRLGVGTEPAGI
jgi:hypothetical protein